MTCQNINVMLFVGEPSAVAVEGEEARVKQAKVPITAKKEESQQIHWVEAILTRSGGFDLVLAHQQQEAILTLCVARIDVVLLDLSSCEAPSLEIISSVRRVAPNIAIVVIGSELDEKQTLDVLDLGVQDYLVKNEITPQFLRRRLLCLKRSTIEKETLRESEAQFRAIFERSSIGIGVTDLENRIVNVNPVFCEMLGYSSSELSGKLLSSCFLPSNRLENTDINQKLLFNDIENAKQRIEIEQRLQRKDGRLVWIHLSASLIPGLNGTSHFLLIIIEDITERKHTELKLRESKEAAEAGSRAKSEFLATMSHELRTPLNAIMGLSQLLQQDIVGLLNDKQREYINCIYSSGEHLLDLINDILDLSKVEAGKEELFLAPLLVRELCDYSVSTVRDRASEKKLELTTSIDPNATACIGDERRVKQMLLNLLTNAIKFTPAGKVSLEVKKITQGISFTVADTGIGIDPRHFHSLFEPFRQLDSKLNRQYEGTGLGLALTRKLARLHGGDVTVESALGKGSRFTLFLPEQISDRYEGMESNSSIPELLENFAASTAQKILLVEAEENTAILLQDYLQTIGYQVICNAFNLGEYPEMENNFLQLVRQSKPDLILLDIMLRGNSEGWSLLKILRQQYDLQDIPVIAMTSNPTDKERDRALAAGADDCLIKPIGIVQLESILMRYL